MLYRVREGTLLLPGKEEERGRLVLTFWCLMSGRIYCMRMMTAKRRDRSQKLNNRADVSNVKCQMSSVKCQVPKCQSKGEKRRLNIRREKREEADTIMPEGEKR